MNSLIRNRLLHILIAGVVVILIGFQGLLIFVAVPHDYVLIYDWIFYAINYVIIFCFLFIRISNQAYHWLQWLVCLILFVANTTFFYYIGDVNLVVSKSPDNEHELILKESKKMKNETVRLKRRAGVFGKKVATLAGSAHYKAVEAGTYNIDWVSGDIAVVTYDATGEGRIEQSIFSMRRSKYVHYRYVAPSLTGKWLERDNEENYFIYDRGEIVYAKDGELFYYQDTADTEQHGIFSITVRGDGEKPSFSVVLNSNCTFEDNDLVNEDCTITILPASLERTMGQEYFRE